MQTPSDIALDIRRNAEYFKKLRFSLVGCRYPNPREKPFLDDAGGPSDDGNFSHRPNPRWFHQRADPAEHTAADHLRWLRQVIDREITFWRMAPGAGIFEDLDPDFRGLAWPEREYVLGSNNACAGVVARLPEGTWTVTEHDVIAQRSRVLSTTAAGRFRFDTPVSRAALVHFRRN